MIKCIQKQGYITKNKRGTHFNEDTLSKDFLTTQQMPYRFENFH